MGCSASRPSTFLTKDSHPEEKPFYACHSPSLSSSSFLQENSTFSSPCLPKKQYSSESQVPRALSLQAPLVHHLPSKKGDSHHLVSLTSTTYGSLIHVEPTDTKSNRQEPPDQPRPPPESSLKAQEKENPGDSLSPDSVINTWELMHGLEDDDRDLGFEQVQSLKSRSSLSDSSFEYSSKPGPFRPLGFDGVARKLQNSIDSVSYEEIVAENPVSFSKPLWKHLSEESFLSKMDPNVISSYWRALSSRQLSSNKESSNGKSVGSSPISSVTTNARPFLNGTESKIVLYFTSLRGIRKSYEDCYAVRMIFRGFRVPVDERDISMDSTFRKELQSVIKVKAMSLPQVFIRGKYIGGVEEIRQLNEAGELAKLLRGFPVRDPKWICESCGDARFVLCTNCSGSKKVFDEEKEQLRRCPDCNENGLIRCPGCCL
uniref:Glutaredoxin family protein n=1 Tax=Rhizophora mucronata TaxID=61149 RepID=A0A2P2M836_RHIMU